MMTSLQTWCLLSLSVLFLSIAPTATEVVGSMSDCEGFLLDEKAPQIPDILVDGQIQDQNRYKIICQTYTDGKRFVTVYDIENRIPVFSAYKYKGEGEKTDRPSWMIEPQLEDENDDRNMRNSGANTYDHQASDMDYSDETKYDRGHLFPFSFAFSRDDKTSTFTLTNIVPQAKGFNQGSWVGMEKCLKCILNQFCKNSNDVPEGYVVTGAQPGTERLNNRVNVPSVLWSAFCCYNKRGKKWIANSFWGYNLQDSVDNNIHTNPLQDPIGNQQYDLFPNKCPVDKTAGETIRQINSNCPCPPGKPKQENPPNNPLLWLAEMN